MKEREEKTKWSRICRPGTIKKVSEPGFMGLKDYQDASRRRRLFARRAAPAVTCTYNLFS